MNKTQLAARNPKHLNLAKERHFQVLVSLTYSRDVATILDPINSGCVLLFEENL